MTQTSDRTKIDAAFRQIADVIRTETHNDVTLFRVVAESIQVNPDYARVLSTNISDVLDDAPGEVEYHDVLIEAYRRTLFARPEETCMKYDMWQGDGDKALTYANTVVALRRGGQHIPNASTALN